MQYPTKSSDVISEFLNASAQFKLYLVATSILDVFNRVVQIL